MVRRTRQIQSNTLFDPRAVSSKAKVHGLVRFDASSGTPVISRQWNVSSITDDGVGLYTINWGTELSSASTMYVTSAGADTTTGTMNGLKNSNAPTVGTTPIKVSSTTNSSGTDLTHIGLAVFQAH